MAKTIIFCADGTWNGPGQDEDHDGTADPTNVFKLFCNLDGVDSPDTTRLANEQEKSLSDAGGAQVAKYLHGVGDSRNVLVKFLGGVAGGGLIARIVRGYTFLSRHYAVGDRIVLVGFSRGAYTVRALAGLIDARGLLNAQATDLTNKEQAYRLGSAVWFDYRREALGNEPVPLNRLLQMAVNLPAFISQRPTASRVTEVPIDVVGVWDTVGALGIPKYYNGATREDPFEFADRKLSSCVGRGVHAVAIDEQRADFTPTLWESDSRVTQWLFAGAHSDVGGGYPIKDGGASLSDTALEWMMEALSHHGVRFAAMPTFVPAPDFRGVAHQPWTHIPWLSLPRAARDLRGFPRHPSVDKRRGCGPVCCEPGTSAVVYEPRNI